MFEVPSAPGQRPALSSYRRVIIAGLLLMGLSFLLIAVKVGVVLAVVPLGLSVVMAAVVWRFGRRWAAFLAAILGLVIVVPAVLLFILAIQSGGRIPLFHTILIFLIAAGALAALVGGIGDFVRRHKA